MTARLCLRLLGGVEVALDGSAVDGFTSAKSLALLSYLATTGCPHTRDALSGLLWGESSTSHARGSLRTALWDLRQKLPWFVTADRQTIAIDAGASRWVDAVVLRESVETALHSKEAPRDGGEPARLGDDQMGALGDAVSLYRGDFMAGFFVSEAPGFEDWMLGERERARQLALQALHRLLSYAKGQRDYRRGIELAGRLLSIAPWQEEIHRELMGLLALDGRRSAALVQYETCHRMLAQELGVEPTIETQLLYRQIRAGTHLRERRRDAAPDSRHALRYDYPGSGAPSLVGRDDAVAALRQALQDPDTRLVSVTGADGVGKTRVARGSAEQMGPYIGDGVWIVSPGPGAGVAAGQNGTEGARWGFDPCSESGLVLDVARAIGLRISARSPARRQVVDYLSTRETLLVLDGFLGGSLGESLGGSPGGSAPSPALEAVVRDILDRAPYVTLLLIGEEAPAVGSECVLHLEGLDVPPRPANDAPSWACPDDLMAYGSVRLFVARALDADPGFELTPRNARHVVRICRSTAGLPLAIELAAAWVGELPAAAIADGIERRSTGQREGGGDQGAAGQALTAAFLYSWDCLSTSDRLALWRLAHLPGTFGREAASRIAGASPATLNRLARKRLLTPQGAARYEWHPALRRVVLSVGRAPCGEIADPGLDAAAIEERYRRHYLTMVAERMSALRGPGAREAAAEVARDWPHVRRACYAVVAHGEIELLEQGLEGLSRFLLLEGWLREAADLLGDTAEGLRIRGECLVETERRVLRARVLTEQARFLNADCLYAHARRAAEEAIGVVSTGRGDGRGSDGQRAVEAAACREAGIALCGEGQVEVGQERLRQGLALVAGESRSWSRATILDQLGVVEMRRGHPGLAREHLRQALGVYEELADGRSTSEVLGQMALARALNGDLERARTHAEEALRLAQRVGDRSLESGARTKLGAIAGAREDYGTATGHCEQALRIARDLGDRRREAEALAELALVQLRQGKKGTAWQQSLLAVELARASGDRVIEARASLVSGHAFAELEMTAPAVDAYEQARRLQEALGLSGQVVESLAGLARARLTAGALGDAQAFVEEILERLNDGELLVVSEPLSVYLACYQVLEAAQDPRTGEVLRAATGLYEKGPVTQDRGSGG